MKTVTPDSPVRPASPPADRRRIDAAPAPLHRRLGAALGLLVLLLAAVTVQAQNVEDGYATSLSDNPNAMVVQADGKTLIGGGFTTVNGQPCARVCRLLPDGSLDPTFASPNPNGVVLDIAVQADGRILIAGVFTSVGGQVRNHVARLRADGRLDTGFADPDVDNGINLNLALQADGKIVIGGQFTSVAGQTRPHIARLNADGSLDTGFVDAGTTNDVHVVVPQADGKLLIGGRFVSIGSQTRRGVARLNADGSLDTSFVDANVDGVVNSLVLRPDGKIMVGGYFTRVGGQSRSYLARLNADGSLDTTLADRQVNDQIWSLLPQPDGKLLLGGDFTSVNGQSQGGIARLNADGSLDARFKVGYTNSRVIRLTLQADDKVLVGGHFSVIDNQPRDFLARLNVDGSLDSTLDDFGSPDEQGSILGATLQPDGKTLISERVDEADSYHFRIRRLHPDGRVDTSFIDPAPVEHGAEVMVAQADGRILVGGGFTGIAGQARQSLVRLNANGSLDPTFSFNGDGSVRRIVVQPDGKIVVLGTFWNVDGQPRMWLARLNANGSLDTSFADAGIQPNWTPINVFFGLALQADGKILVMGHFESIGGQRAGLARLNADGSLDTSFHNPTFTWGTAASLALQPDGKLLLGGQGMTRLNTDGSVDTSFSSPAAWGWVHAFALRQDGRIAISVGDQTSGSRVILLTAAGLQDTTFSAVADDRIDTIVSQADGKLLLAGMFSSVNNKPRNHLARLSMRAAALQTLVVDGSTVTWRRSGVGPELRSAPMLSYSSDGSTFTPLGPMTRIGGGWQRTGAPMPFGSLYYLRADARIGSGSGDGLIRSVRQAYHPSADGVFSNGFE